MVNIVVEQATGKPQKVNKGRRGCRVRKSSDWANAAINDRRRIAEHNGLWPAGGLRPFFSPPNITGPNPDKILSEMSSFHLLR